MPLAGPILTRIIIYVVLALGLFGGWKLYLSHVKNQGKQEVLAQATATEAANLKAAAVIDAQREADRVKSDADWKRKLAAAKAAKADKCSEAPALPDILKGLQ